MTDDEICSEFESQGVSHVKRFMSKIFCPNLLMSQYPESMYFHICAFLIIVQILEL
jgi:hypothetical protein